MFGTLLDCDSLFKELNNPDWVIVDTRYDLMDKNAGRSAYLQGHIPRAIYVDLHDDLSGPPVTNRGRHPLPTTAAMNALFSRLGITKESQVIVYDNVSGSFAARLWWMLKHMQHKHVAVLDGGWQAWEEYNGPVCTESCSPTPGHFDSTASKSDIVEIEQVMDFERVIDSRDPARYHGEIEPIDKAAGHIPGAKNRFWKDNLTASGRFKEKAVLQREFEQLLGKTPVENSVFYCGSGVTACHNLLAAFHAGLPMPKLYAGSWSEWSSTPGKAVETGD